MLRRCEISSSISQKNPVTVFVTFCPATRLVQNAAKAVPPGRRDEFLQKLAARLTAEPSDAAVAAALNAQLDQLPQRYFLCDGMPKGNIK